MKVLVIGGSGFIGKAVISHLLYNRYDVTAYTKNDCNGMQEKCKTILGDLQTSDDLESALEGIEAVIYLVTSTTPQTSAEDNLATYTKDVPMLLKVLDACISCNIKRVVYASSGGTVYGDCTEANKENSDVWPISHYAIGKLTCEKILNMYNELYGMENISLRIANPYGMGQTLSSGVGAVTAFTNQILNRKAIKLFGDGTAIRDFLTVEHVAAAFHCALEWEFSSAISAVFNIGSGVGISLNTILSIVSEGLQLPCDIEYLPARRIDVVCNYLDVSKAISILGYIPPKDPKDDILRFALKMKEIREYNCDGKC